MTKKNAKDFLPLVQALVDEKLQEKFTHGWVDCKVTDFTREINLYRIKPSPREVVMCEECFARMMRNEGNGEGSYDPHFTQGCNLAGHHRVLFREVV